MYWRQAHTNRKTIFLRQYGVGLWLERVHHEYIMFINRFARVYSLIITPGVSKTRSHTSVFSSFLKFSQWPVPVEVETQFQRKHIVVVDTQQRMYLIVLNVSGVDAQRNVSVHHDRAPFSSSLAFWQYEKSTKNTERTNRFIIS